MKYFRSLFLSFMLIVLSAVVSFAEPVGEWSQDYVKKVQPIIMSDPFFAILGVSNSDQPYTYEEVVKMNGHSCQVTAAAWIMTKLALEKLYPGQVPVRGQIRIQAPGAEDEWNFGVMGRVMAYITGATNKAGYDGGPFKVNDTIVRKNKLVHTQKPTGAAPKNMEFIFTRIDNGKSVGVKWKMAEIKPPLVNQQRLAKMGKDFATGKASPEDLASFQKEWNDAVRFHLDPANVNKAFAVRVIK